jgi:elongation factor 3
MASKSNILSLLEKALSNATTEDRQSAAKELATLVKSTGISAGLVEFGVLESLKKATQDKKSDHAREGALFVYKELATQFGHPVEPYLIPEITSILSGYGDKQAAVKQAAKEAAEAFFAIPGRFSVKLLVPLLLENLTNEKKWQTKMAALTFLKNLTKTSASQVQLSLPLIVPAVSDNMWDSKPEVKQAATECMEQVCETLDNLDVVPFLPALISCIMRPEEVPECIYKLSATTFVQQVEAPTLAIMVPLMVRALTERKPAIQRQTVVIIDNMCKLVENPADAHQFLPKLMPGLDRIIDIAADPELRTVASNARATMVRVGGGESTDVEDPAAVHARLAQELIDTATRVSTEVTKVSPKVTIDALTVSYIASLITVMYDTRVLALPDWTPTLAPFFQTFLSHDETKAVIKPLHEFAVAADKLRQKDSDDYDPEEGEELCNCEFSLAYGGMILLNNTKLRLTRGQRYGLVGPNGAGNLLLI